MQRNRYTILIAGLVAAALAIAPGAACASSLLSGYGGPGQGSQAILGSGLINGPRGGSGGSGGGAGTGGGGLVSTSARPGVIQAQPNSAEATRAAAVKHGTASAPTDRTRASVSGHSVHAPSGLDRAVPMYPASEITAQKSSSLGLTVADLTYLMLALAAIGGTLLLTRRLSRAGKSGSGDGARAGDHEIRAS